MYRTGWGLSMEKAARLGNTAGWKHNKPVGLGGSLGRGRTIVGVECPLRACCAQEETGHLRWGAQFEGCTARQDDRIWALGGEGIAGVRADAAAERPAASGSAQADCSAVGLPGVPVSITWNGIPSK